MACIVRGQGGREQTTSLSKLLPRGLEEADLPTRMQEQWNTGPDSVPFRPHAEGVCAWLPSPACAA